MTEQIPDDVIEDAKAAGLPVNFGEITGILYNDITDELIKFAQLQRQRERKEQVSEAVPLTKTEQDILRVAHKNSIKVIDQPQSVREAYEKAADLAVQWGNARLDDRGGNALRNYAEALLALIQPLSKDE